MLFHTEMNVILHWKNATEVAVDIVDATEEEEEQGNE